MGTGIDCYGCGQPIEKSVRFIRFDHQTYMIDQHCKQTIHDLIQFLHEHPGKEVSFETNNPTH